MGRLASMPDPKTCEQCMRRLSEELHDGPAQLIGLALLRLHELDLTTGGGDSDEHGGDVMWHIRSVLADALKEIRDLSAGLVLPELSNTTLSDSIATAMSLHERRTGKEVTSDIGSLPDVSIAVKNCIYRLVQEGLANSARHAEGKGQQVNAAVIGDTLRIEVSDTGPGFVPERASKTGARLGLAGLRNRIETLGGMFRISSVLGQGTTLIAWFPLAGSATEHVSGDALSRLGRAEFQPGTRPSTPA
jgi:signal transduction histidine kinase